MGQVKSALVKLLSPSGKSAKIGTLLKRGSYQYSFTSLSAGRVTISWYYAAKSAHLSKAKAKPVLVATGNASFSKAGTVKLTVKLNAQGRQMLSARMAKTAANHAQVRLRQEYPSFSGAEMWRFADVLCGLTRKNGVMRAVRLMSAFPAARLGPDVAALPWLSRVASSALERRR